MIFPLAKGERLKQQAEPPIHQVVERTADSVKLANFIRNKSVKFNISVENSGGNTELQ